MENMLSFLVIFCLAWLLFGGLAKYDYWHASAGHDYHAGWGQKVKTSLIKLISHGEFEQLSWLRKLMARLVSFVFSHRMRNRLINVTLIGGGLVSLLWCAIKEIGPERAARARHKY